jgi:hypothetical protein
LSSLAWIDFDETERQRAQRIMALFQERESRDELGLGAVRDSIADRLFPGTSTIQTRLRYMLFVPWVLRMVEDRDDAPNQLMNEARSLEIRLANALLNGGETIGVIGRDAGPRLKRLPSSVYWAGLETWGIRIFPGSIDSYFSSLRTFRRGRRRLRDGDEVSSDAQVTHIWHPALPTRPKELLDTAKFRLTTDEAEFIIDRLVVQQPEALLTILAREGIDADCLYIWEHPNLADFPKAPRHLVEHGKLFSSVMHAPLLRTTFSSASFASEMTGSNTTRTNWLSGAQNWIRWPSKHGRSTISGVRSDTRRTPSSRPQSVSSPIGSAWCERVQWAFLNLCRPVYW